MSEHYDFHYQPTGSGAISGQQVLQQTEDAINELGDYVNDNVGGAMDVAQQALETAQNAEQDAQTALDTANSFSSAIQSAQQDASTALSTAQTAQTTASNASNTAIQAQQDASNAVTTANNASGQVSTLSGTVTALGQRVTTTEGNIGQNTSDITALTTRVGTAEGNITTLQNDVSIAQGNASSAMATAGTVKQQAYVLRYSSASVTDNSTIAYSTLDNTDNIKSGDKVIDVDGKIFSVVSVDTTNQTVTVGTALIDLALDANVVHNTGNENVGGVKTFSSNALIYNSDATATTPNLYLRSSKMEVSSQGNTSGDQNLTYLDKNGTTYAFIKGAIQSNGSAVKIRAIAKDSSDNSVINELQILAYTNGSKAIFPSYSNEIDLGVSNYKWKSFNGVEPSSLSLPSGNVSDVIDISSYLVNLDGTINTYTAPANGWITITCSGCTGITFSIINFWANGSYRENPNQISSMIPICKNQKVGIYIYGGSPTIQAARFIPCQGNV